MLFIRCEGIHEDHILPGRTACPNLITSGKFDVCARYCICRIPMVVDTCYFTGDLSCPRLYVTEHMGCFSASFLKKLLHDYPNLLLYADDIH